MPDVFLSYASQDRDLTRRYAEAFEAAGLDVWWDNDLRSGEAFDEKIEKALEEAKAVVVLWSTTSVASRWVRAEATMAERKGTFIPVMVEACKRPIMFELSHTADLSHWKGKATDPAWLALLADVRRLVEGKGVPASAPAASASKAQAKPGRKLVFGAIAAVLAIAIAAAAYFALRPAGNPGGLDPHRTAFFGFTADASDPIAAAMAKAATDEVFQTMNTADLETASRTQTQGVPLADQLDRAKKLGARFALGGDVRIDGKNAKISLRLDDVSTQQTLWEGTVPGAASDTVSMPVLAGASATRLMRCLISTHDGLGQVNAEIMAILPRACAEVYAPTQDTVRLWRKLTQLSPKYARFYSTLAWTISQAPKPDQSLAIREGKAAAQQAVALNPKDPLARGILASIAGMEGVPLAQLEQMYLAAIKDSPREGLSARTVATNPVSGEVGVLAAAGRNKEALPYARQNVENDSLNPTIRFQLAVTLVRVGRPEEATQVFDEMNARSSFVGDWEVWVMYAAFNGLGGVDHAMASVPAKAPKDAVACWTQITQAAASSNAQVKRAGLQRLLQCLESGSVTRASFSMIAALGDLDTAFAQADQRLSPRNGNFRNLAAGLFDKSAAAMRADPRFLPLVTRIGLMDYWKTTKTQPDLCETENVPFCAALKAN